VLRYKSRKLKEHERLYVTHDLELAVIVHDLKMWRHYLMGKRFELRIDHCCLKYLFARPSLNVEQSRWLEFLSVYDFEINHIKGKENKVTDTLNMRMHEMHDTTIIMYQTYLSERILEVSKSNLRYVDIKPNLQQSMPQQKIEVYELREDGILMYRRRIYVPNDQELKSLIFFRDA
jgi:hypothetical protein